MTPQDSSAYLITLAARAPVIPVLVVEDETKAAPLAEALVAGGLALLEVTLRTSSALDALARMTEVPGAVVGAGTVITPEDARAAKAAGAQFAVSPGATPALIAACTGIGLPLLPGAASASEVMALLAAGFSFAKFFPAAQIGGAPGLKSLGGPLPQMRFCPTGGITPESAPGYLSLKNVACIGGSWIAPPDLLAKEDFAAIRRLATAAAALRG
ncbi:bifunctional 4-hydroxy-2-oxoglutarate aldolase/2-dehydro-3-deoxy-phosphogluconate aldolase [Falsigemmobacter intermedius]|uniref:2-dehydro-3-deoxy-phosphogluconate aldolase n=1 Tax=Falsigemmobacter intermedius TaxID=1553448 RepID=A0A444MBK7_9RHOB|nr:bifunctional 4-hydroxy-2-oxoglutarate aldolase/2-dehydro-3-deoxy-phosphogluconate aldolase [Falsigemmobacter intermedius]RWY41121.1 bifunctional 4-hydroxy-2-oxoglutarate aldolase/2-dehydro-3-deoxy-phosphogluconate aldolase [Falsigemmobacter intermedius]